MTHYVSEIIRQLVRDRANHRCEYCHKPEKSSLYKHQVDHIIPRLHGGILEVSNLAWSCFHCNTTKSANVASYDTITGELTPLYHPRIHVWTEHFNILDAEIVGLTAIGRVTVRILQFNHPEQLRIRRSLIKASKWD